MSMKQRKSNVERAHLGLWFQMCLTSVDTRDDQHITKQPFDANTINNHLRAIKTNVSRFRVFRIVTAPCQFSQCPAEEARAEPV